ncbi:MAG: hypothetical protein KIT84_22425 [Labilithrix sp.]|nr:hypothetical protein [Labilithrix sp.]MCW5813801.1 hypothetical protein [Labilithrix sp.]
MGSPSLTHEGLLLLFKNRPELAAELLRDALGVALPAYVEARLDSADLTDAQPTEYRADLVILLVDGKPVLGIVLEVQLELKKGDRKLYTWPVYVANLRARLECPVCVLVVTPSEAVAERARAPIELGPGSTVTPFVVGPKAVPIVRDAAAAARDPELAVLSAMAHGKDEPDVAISVATTALAACRHLDDERAMLYLDLVAASLGKAARTAFEDLMGQGNYVFQSDFFKKHLAEGKAAAKAEGKAAGKAEGILEILDARKVAVSDEQKGRVLACTDIALLGRWLRKAVAVTSAEELFVE